MSFQHIDESILRSINLGYNNPLLDKIMVTLSDHVFLGTPVLLMLLYFIFKKNWKMAGNMLLMGAAIGLLDSFCTFVLKENIQRLRPCRALDYVRVVYRCGGKYGYVSNHAANSFALATFLYLSTSFRLKILFYLVAFLIALSRVYLGVHYPFDVLSGGVLGSIWAWFCYRTYKKRRV